ncbi:MAG: O-antigen ligase family protein [Candidatus Melainabacteria bacterium]|nr:O-antigen ligase family protein [Candidatus Melainabacteria bacterium]
MSIPSLIIKLDSWSDTTIKESFIGIIFKKFFSTPIRRYAVTPLRSLLYISICFLFASLSFPQFANDRFGIGVIILFCFLVFLLNIFLNNFLLKANFNFIDFLILVFLCILIISTFSSYFLKESIVGLYKYIIFFLWYFLIKLTLQNSSSKSFFLLWCFLISCAVVTSIIGINQYFIGVEPLATWEDPEFENTHTRVYSTLGNPNLLGGYLLLLLPITVLLPYQIKTSFMLKLLFFSVSILILVCLIFTGSRGGYLGLISGILSGAIIIFQKSNFKKLVFFLVLLIFSSGIIFLFPIIQERLLTIFTLREHTSNSYRINVWLACFKMLKDNFLFGVGPGNNTFRLAYGLYMISGFDALAAYNIFLEIAIETGIIGAFIFILIFLTSFLKLYSLFWNKGNIFALGLLLSLIAIIVHGMFDTVFFRGQIFIPYFFLLASIGRMEIRELEN